MTSPWIETARLRLIHLRGRREGWSYRQETAPCVEPTILACLGLMSSAADRQAEQAEDEFRRPADWLASLQSLDGSLGVSATLPTPCWATPYGVLLWAALGGYTTHRERRSAVAARPGGGCDPQPRRAGAHRRSRHGDRRLALGRRYPFVVGANGRGHPGPAPGGEGGSSQGP